MTKEEDYQKPLTKGRYQIIRESNKEGIKTIDGNIIIDCIFDDISWIPETDLVLFTLNGEKAICRVDEIPSL